MQFWARKPVAELIRASGAEVGQFDETVGNPDSQHRLKRSLGPVSLTAFGVGGTIGAGIFVLTGTIAAHEAGPAVVLSYLLASFVCVLAGLCYAELAAMVPVTGSAYSYSYAAIGEGVAWIIGWNLLLEWLFSGSLVAIGWSGYITAILADLRLPLPVALTLPPIDFPDGHTLTVTGGVINLPAVLITIFCTVILVFGIKESAWVNNLMVFAKVAAILAVVAFGLPLISMAHLTPFIPPSTGHSGFGWPGIVHGGAIAFFAYIGFDGVSTLAQEARDPQRTMPISLAASLGICTLLYVAVCVVITGIVDYRDLDVADPIYLVLERGGPRLSWLKAPVGAAVVIGLVSVVLLSLLSQVRIFYAMARDGLIPKVFMRIHPRWRTPHIGTMITGAVAALAAGVLPLGLLGELISIGTLMAFATVCIAVLVLRRTTPDAHRPFRTPWLPWIPLAGAGACFALMFGLPSDTWIRLAVWLGVGTAIYLLYGVRHSHVQQAIRRAKTQPDLDARAPS